MIQHAIYEHCNGVPIDRLILNGMMHPRDSTEYMYHKPCIEFWIGVAMGKGMCVTCYGFNSLCKPLSWETGKYGYARNVNQDLCIQTLRAAYEACYQYPRKFMTADGELALGSDVDTLVAARKKHEEAVEVINKALNRVHT